MTEELAEQWVGELKERLRPFIGRPLAEVRPKIIAEVEAFVREKEAEWDCPALRETLLSVTRAYLRVIAP